MNECPYCNHRFASALDSCPRCGGAPQATGPSSDGLGSTGAHHQYVPIARFANVAEAGFFHSELEGQLNCDLRIVSQNQFDASNATWWTHYVLSAPAAAAEDAAALLKQLIAETEQDEPLEETFETSLSPLSRDGDLPVSEPRIHWAPIILTLTAGTFVIWAAKQVHRHARGPADARPTHMDVWEQLGQEGRPWVQDVGNGRGRRELLINLDEGFATVREDRNGDGVFESNARISLVPSEQ